MAFKAAHSAHIMLDSVAGTLQNISSYADSLDFPQPVDTVEVSVFGTVAKQFVPGLTDGGVIGVSGPLDTALGTHIAGLKAAQAAGSSTASISYAPFGSVSGLFRVTAEAYVSAFNVSTGVSGRVEYSASLQVSGAVTNTQW